MYLVAQMRAAIAAARREDVELLRILEGALRGGVAKRRLRFVDQQSLDRFRGRDHAVGHLPEQLVLLGAALELPEAQSEQ